MFFVHLFQTFDFVFLLPILVNGYSTGTAYPITKIEELNEEWTVDEFVVNESQTYPCYIVYYK